MCYWHCTLLQNSLVRYKQVFAYLHHQLKDLYLPFSNSYNVITWMSLLWWDLLSKNPFWLPLITCLALNTFFKYFINWILPHLFHYFFCTWWHINFTFTQYQHYHIFRIFQGLLYLININTVIPETSLEVQTSLNYSFANNEPENISFFYIIVVSLQTNMSVCWILMSSLPPY